MVVDEEIVDKLIRQSTTVQGYTISTDLTSQSIKATKEELDITFDIDVFRKYTMLNGLDDIGLTLQHEDRIHLYEQNHL